MFLTGGGKEEPYTASILSITISGKRANLIGVAYGLTCKYVVKYGALSAKAKNAFVWRSNGAEGALLAPRMAKKEETMRPFLSQTAPT